MIATAWQKSGTAYADTNCNCLKIHLYPRLFSVLLNIFLAASERKEDES
jgi:hypothetical protein